MAPLTTPKFDTTGNTAINFIPHNSATFQILYATFLLTGSYPYVGYENQAFGYYGKFPARQNSPIISYQYPAPSSCPPVNSVYSIDQPAVNPYYKGIKKGCRSRAYFALGPYGEKGYSFQNFNYSVTSRPWYKTCKSHALKTGRAIYS